MSTDAVDKRIEERRCHPQAVHDFAVAVLTAMGAPDDIGEVVAAHLVRAHLVGHDSHGVLRLPGYERNHKRGRLTPDARPRWLREDGSTGLLDARRGFGQYALRLAVDWAVARARDNGVAVVAVRQSSHTGRLGDFVEQAAAERMIAQLNVGMLGQGVGMTVPFGGSGRFMGSNPWAIGIPLKDSDPIVMDGAMSVVAAGKVMLAAQRGELLDEGVLVDPLGRPTRDPTQLEAGGGLMPLGGELAGHKGSGLALVGALLGALAIIDDPDPLLLGPGEPQGGAGWVGGVLLTVIDPERFGSFGEYSRRVQRVLDALVEVEPTPGSDGPRPPGSRAAASRRRREQEGIPIPDGTWELLRLLADRQKVPMPATISNGHDEQTDDDH